MNNTASSSVTISIAQKILDAVWPYVSGGRGLILAAVSAAVVGVALNWGWLVAVGATPLLIAVLPCAVMCAVGLCINHKR